MAGLIRLLWFITMVCGVYQQWTLPDEDRDPDYPGDDLDPDYLEQHFAPGQDMDWEDEPPHYYMDHGESERRCVDLLPDCAELAASPSGVDLCANDELFMRHYCAKACRMC